MCLASPIRGYRNLCQPLALRNLWPIMTEIEVHSSLTPVSGDMPSYPLCVEIVDRKIIDYIASRNDSPSSFHKAKFNGSDLSAVTTTVPCSRRSRSPPVNTTVPCSPPSGNRVTKRPKRRHVQEFFESIASRLPARSKATIHRRPHASIAQNLVPRKANRATSNRLRVQAKSNRHTALKI